MATLVLIGTGLFVLAFAVVPRLVRAQVRGRTASLTMGHAPDGISMPAGRGLRQVSIAGGEITARVIESRLLADGLDVRLHADSGAGLGAIAAVYTLLYCEQDEEQVLDAVATGSD